MEMAISVSTDDEVNEIKGWVGMLIIWTEARGGWIVVVAMVTDGRSWVAGVVVVAVVVVVVSGGWDTVGTAIATAVVAGFFLGSILSGEFVTIPRLTE